MFPISMAPGPHSSISEEFSGLRSWNLVNLLLSMNEALMDECAARLQPLVDQYKPRQHQTFAIEKFRDLIVTTTTTGTKISLLKKVFKDSLSLHHYLSNLFIIFLNTQYKDYAKILFIALLIKKLFI